MIDDYLSPLCTLTHALKEYLSCWLILILVLVSEQQMTIGELSGAILWKIENSKADGEYDFFQ